MRKDSGNVNMQARLRVQAALALLCLIETLQGQTLTPSSVRGRVHPFTTEYDKKLHKLEGNVKQISDLFNLKVWRVGEDSGEDPGQEFTFYKCALTAMSQ